MMNLNKQGLNYTDPEEVQAYYLCMQKLKYTENEANSIRELLQIKNTDLILEIGMVTGELALKLSGNCKKVVALDISNDLFCKNEG